VPSLVEPVLKSGTLRGMTQPTLSVRADFVLRPWSPQDVYAVKRAFDDQDIRMWHTRRIDTDAEALTWVTSWSQRWEAETDVSWALARFGTDEVVGQVGLRTVFLEAAAAQMSYWLLPEARGQGLAVSGTRAVQAWAFSELGLRRLALQHSVHNTRSCRVAVAAGFELEGTLRRYMLHSDGLHDTHVHAVLAR
jgi:ribosomal-protein-alanine N-acetyltransferase